GKGGSGTQHAPPTEGGSASGGKDDGEAIKYPDEEINPEDIPF
ncbi:single-stranded DNA-binding protein, partial [Candidatus Kaiserbacteria bacterium]|nr:single-stranded DNA-binding protein [Candidatus Kaiserbacteria bacterium]